MSSNNISSAFDDNIDTKKYIFEQRKEKNLRSIDENVTKLVKILGRHNILTPATQKALNNINKNNYER